MNVDFKGKQGNEPERPFFYYHLKRLLRWDSNPQPAFRAIALPTEHVLHALVHCVRLLYVLCTCVSTLCEATVCTVYMC